MTGHGVIELRDIGFRYDQHQVLDGVDLALEEGELVLVSGRTGVGKSTLLGLVTGLVPRFNERGPSRAGWGDGSFRQCWRCCSPR